MDRHNQSPLGPKTRPRDESSGTTLQLNALKIQEDRSLQDQIPFEVAEQQQVRTSAEHLDDDDDVVQGESPRVTLPSTPAEVPKGHDGEFLEITNTVAAKQGRKKSKDESEDGPSGQKQKSVGKISAKSKQISDYQPSGKKINKINLDTAFRDQPIPLITWSQARQKFELNPEARAVVENIQGPIGVLAVAGMYRTGKSYMLNRVFLNLHNDKNKAEMQALKTESGFNVGPTINPCTKGLWMWGKPIVGHTAEGKLVNVIVIDTEGLGGLDEDNNHDMRIFSLALLLSSYFVYNSMGSIDENALQTLSFVTDMTKYIKTQVQDQDQQLQKHMPKFMWVVRDFSLQLVDDQDQEITPQQYLEQALAETTSALKSNKDAEAKNQIRKQLKKYFPVRDCCTLIRPIVNEDNLQNLNKMALEEMRPDFVQSTFRLRKQVLSEMKLKALSDNLMDGAMWVGLAEQYLEAVNGGTVPSIESSWTYICKQRLTSSADSLKMNFLESLSTDLQQPCSDQELLKFEELSLETAKKDLLKAVQGTEDETFTHHWSQLAEFIKERVEEVKQENLEQQRQQSSNTLNQLFHELNQRFLSDSSMQSLAVNVQQLELTFSEIQSLYDQNVVDFSEKYLIFLNAKSAFLNDLVYFLHQNMEKENQALVKQVKDHQERAQEQDKEARDNHRLEKQALDSRIKELLLSATEAEAQLSLLKEQHQDLKLQREQSDAETQQQLREAKEQLQRRVEEGRKDKDEFEDRLQEVQRETVQARSEFEKERALQDQKIQFLEKTLAEKSSKEKQYLSSLTNQKQELSTELRQASSKYEAELKSLSQQLTEEQEKAQELETQLAEVQLSLQSKTTLWKEQEERLKAVIENKKQHVAQLEQSTSSMKPGSLAALESQLKEKSEKLEAVQGRLQEGAKRQQQAEEELKLKLTQAQKDNALKDQKIEFVQIQLEETTHKFNYLNKQYSLLCQQKAEEQEKEEQAPEVLQESPSKVDRLTRKNQQLQTQLTQALDKAEDLESQLQNLETEGLRTHKELSRRVDDLEQQKLSLQGKSHNSESDHKQIIASLEERYKNDIQVLELELEEKQNNFDAELKSLQQKSEESLSQLKEFYEQEKDKQEQRIRDEREKAQKKIAEFQEEFDHKIRVEFVEKEEEIEMLRESLAEVEQRFGQFSTQNGHDLSMKQQQVETLQTQNQELNNRIQNIESTRNQTFEKQFGFFEQQRQEQNQKLEKMQADNIEKERLISQLQNKLERAQEDSDRKLKDLQSGSQVLEREKETLTAKIEAVKKKLGEAQSESQQNQLVFGRDQALSQQSIEFLQNKINELTEQLDQKTQLFENRISIIRQEIHDQYQIDLERAKSEKELWEQKLEQRKKAFKETEHSLSREKDDLEQSVSQLQMTLVRLEQDKRQQEVEFQGKLQEYEDHIHNLETSEGEAHFFGNSQVESVMHLKTQIMEFEKELQDTKSKYELEKGLWEGKLEFVSKQKDQYKLDYLDMQKKFETTLDQLKKRGNHDKFEAGGQQVAKVLEAKYKGQIKEMVESHNALHNELQNKIKRLEDTNKKLSQQVALLSQELDLERSQFESKKIEIKSREQHFQNDLSFTKQESDRRVQELQDLLRKEKEAMKLRVGEAEKKAKFAEQQKTQMIFDIEKEKAQFQVSIDQLLAEKREMEDIIKNIERRKDMLYQENQRLKHNTQNRSSIEGRLSAGSGGPVNSFGLRSSGLGYGSQTSLSKPSGIPHAPIGSQLRLSQQRGKTPNSATGFSLSKPDQQLPTSDQQPLHEDEPEQKILKQKINFQQQNLNTRYGDPVNSSKLSQDGSSDSKASKLSHSKLIGNSVGSSSRKLDFNQQ